MSYTIGHTDGVSTGRTESSPKEAKDIYGVLGWGHKVLPPPLTQQGQVPSNT